MEDRIPQNTIDAVAEHINQRNTKQYGISILGDELNAETPHSFEILPFDEIDNCDRRFFAIDGSYNSHSFYNGLALGLYRAGFVCYQRGKQVRVNTSSDPIILGRSYTPSTILVTSDQHLLDIYDELLLLDPVKAFIDFLSASAEKIFAWPKEAVCKSFSTLLSFAQEILEWSMAHEIAKSNESKSGDFILKDGTVRSLNIKQEHIVKLGKLLADKKLTLVGITKNSPIKMELNYTLRQIDAYLQDKLKPKYPFKENDPRRQKLCCWFEVSDAVLATAYPGVGNMYAKKTLRGGRGIGLFFAARLDYVEKLQNYDWVIADLSLFDAVPGIEADVQTRDLKRIQEIFYDLTRLTQEHYILGYPYPLVEAHNFVTLKSDFQEELIGRVKQSMYSSQQMDHIDIENLFLDIHSRF